MDSIIRSVVTVPYAALLNAKLIIHGNDEDFVAVDRHFLMFCMLPLLQNIKVDESWYLQKYPDILAAIEQGIVASATAHYVRHGYFENRMPYRIIVDADWYLDQYPDVRAAIGQGEFASAQRHFETVGYAEGRLPYANFTLTSEIETADRTLSGAPGTVRNRKAEDAPAFVREEEHMAAQ